MFLSCSSIESLVLSSFTSESLYTMALAFNNCKNLQTITFSEKFTIEEVERMDELFNNDENLRFVDLSHFNTINVQKMSS